LLRLRPPLPFARLQHRALNAEQRASTDVFRVPTRSVRRRPDAGRRCLGSGTFRRVIRRDEMQVPMRTHKKRPASVTCPECHSRFAVKPHGRVPKFCCQRCRQRAAEKRKWLRPAPLVAIAHDIESARSRAAIREEAWLLLKQMRLMGPKAHPCENVR